MSNKDTWARIAVIAVILHGIGFLVYFSVDPQAAVSLPLPPWILSASIVGYMVEDKFKRVVFVATILYAVVFLTVCSVNTEAQKLPYNHPDDWLPLLPGILSIVALGFIRFDVMDLRAARLLALIRAARRLWDHGHYDRSDVMYRRYQALHKKDQQQGPEKALYLVSCLVCLVFGYLLVRDGYSLRLIMPAIVVATIVWTVLTNLRQRHELKAIAAAAALPPLPPPWPLDAPSQSPRRKEPPGT